MSMKAYAVFAKKTEAAQKEGDYTIWHFLNDTDDLVEATHWYLVAKNHNDYDDVQLVQASNIKVQAVLKNDD